MDDEWMDFLVLQKKIRDRQGTDEVQVYVDSCMDVQMYVKVEFIDEQIGTLDGWIDG